MRKIFTVKIDEIALISSVLEVSVDDERGGRPLSQDELNDRISEAAYSKLSMGDYIEQEMDVRDAHLCFEEGRYLAPQLLAGQEPVREDGPDEHGYFD